MKLFYLYIKPLAMSTRDLLLLQNRPLVPSAHLSSEMSFDERFQNKTLRPVIHFQRDLFVAAFRNYIEKHKNVFYTYTIEKRLDYITNSLQKDIKFRNSLKGMVIGQFTTEEYALYITNSSSLNKRMMNLVRESLQENIQLLDIAV